MSNMSYCRFENTLADLTSCEEHLDETAELSDSEKRARAELIELCKRIAKEYGSPPPMKIESARRQITVSTEEGDSIRYALCELAGRRAEQALVEEANNLRALASRIAGELPDTTRASDTK